MVDVLIQTMAEVSIVGNRSGYIPSMKGLSGALIGYTDEGNPIVDFFNPEDGKLHTWEFHKDDVEEDL